ncbi:SBBP repeat-containing protein [Flavobacteriales bacterium]|nr:SBBP repeat-containing protein [Flavobacteriales bacterium]
MKFCVLFSIVFFSLFTFAQDHAFKWAKQISGLDIVHPQSIAIDGSGNVYSTGQFYGTVDFDSGAGVFNLTSAGGSDIYIQKLDANGNLIWAKQMGGAASVGDRGQSIAIDGSGNVYSTGFWSGTADFDPGAGVFNLTSAGGGDIYIQKLDANGNFIWAKRIAPKTSSVQSVAKSIAIDGSGNVFCTDYFAGTNDFDPGPGVFNLTSVNSGAHAYIVQLDANGNFIWAKQMGDTLNNGGVTPTSIAVDDSANVYSTVLFSRTVDFDPGPGQFILDDLGADGGYVQKLSLCTPSTGTDVQTACDTYDWIDGNTYTATNNSAQWTLTNVAGCDSVVTLNLTINTVDATATQSGDINIEANTSGATYQWLDCNDNYSEINGETNQQFTATANGDYAVEVTMNGCADTSNCYTVTTIGIIENSFGNQLVVYPNPTIGNCTIDLGETYNSVSVTISDVKGKLIQSNTFKDSQLLDLNLSEPNGVYLLKIESDSNKAIIRILKR